VSRRQRHRPSAYGPSAWLSYARISSQPDRDLRRQELDDTPCTVLGFQVAIGQYRLVRQVINLKV
jgi:hypothetical protein